MEKCEVFSITFYRNAYKSYGNVIKRGSTNEQGNWSNTGIPRLFSSEGSGSLKKYITAHKDTGKGTISVDTGKGKISVHKGKCKISVYEGDNCYFLTSLN